MIFAIVVGEGPTEEAFIRDVLAPSFAMDTIYLEPRLIRTSAGGRGGALNVQRVLSYLRNTLRQRGDTYVTTFFDLYGLDHDFPGFAEGRTLPDPLARARLIEQHFKEAVVREAGVQADRFFAHIQPYEFEALLFSDVTTLVTIEPDWRPFASQLNEARVPAPSPEHINDGSETHPSARLESILRGPGYDKVRHGPIAAQHIGLPRIQQECQHFATWLERLRSLRPLV